MTSIHLEESRDPTHDVTLRELLHLLELGPVQGIFSATRVRLPEGAADPEEVVWYEDAELTTRIASRSFEPAVLPTSIVSRLYDPESGAVVLEISDTVTYVGGVESRRDRAIAAPTGLGLPAYLPFSLPR